MFLTGLSGGTAPGAAGIVLDVDLSPLKNSFACTVNSGDVVKPDTVGIECGIPRCIRHETPCSALAFTHVATAEEGVDVVVIINNATGKADVVIG